MCGQIVQHDDLPRSQCRTEFLTDIPLERITIDGTFHHERCQRTTALQGTNQGLILAPVPWGMSHGSLVAGCSTIQAGQGGIEAALIQKHQASWCGEQRGEIVQELCAPFLIPFAGDQRFFYA